MPTKKAKVLNSEEVSAAQAQGDKIAASANNVVTDKTFVFFAAFEGTNNIKMVHHVRRIKLKLRLGSHLRSSFEAEDCMPRGSNVIVWEFRKKESYKRCDLKKHDLGP